MMELADKGERHKRCTGDLHKDVSPHLDAFKAQSPVDDGDVQAPVNTGIEQILDAVLEFACAETGASWGVICVTAKSGISERVVRRGHLDESLASRVTDDVVADWRHFYHGDRCESCSTRVDTARRLPTAVSAVTVPVRRFGGTCGVVVLGVDSEHSDQAVVTENSAVRVAQITSAAMDHLDELHEFESKVRWLNAAADVVALVGRSGGDTDVWKEACERLRSMSGCQQVRWSPEPDKLEGRGYGPELRVPLVVGSELGGELLFEWAPSARYGPSLLPDARLIGERMGTSWLLACMQAYRARLAVLEDRDRIARDLHDLVIQRLFSIGLVVESISLTEGLSNNKVFDRVIDDIDDTIKDLRRTIFALQQRPTTFTLHGQMESLLAEYVDILGFYPGLKMIGPYWEVNDEAISDLLCVVRESLSNIARHAQASMASVEVSIIGTDLTAEIHDNGVGFVLAGIKPSGLANLRKRAVARGGRLDIISTVGGGTRLVWKASVGE